MVVNWQPSRDYRESGTSQKETGVVLLSISVEGTKEISSYNDTSSIASNLVKLLESRVPKLIIGYRFILVGQQVP